jgi:hypothetical protein
LTDPVDPEWVRQSFTWFPRLHQVPDWYIEARVADGCRLPARVWRDALSGLTRPRRPTETGSLAAPTLILWGDRDELLPRADQDRLATVIPSSRLVIYENTGHLVLWEQPDRVAADLADFAMNLEHPGTLTVRPCADGVDSRGLNRRVALNSGSPASSTACAGVPIETPDLAPLCVKKLF